jgi:hypothetical protein
MSAHTPGQQCDECEGFCLVPVVLLQTPVLAVEWVCHAATTIKDASGKVLAECSGHGRHSVEDEALAAEIVRRLNAHDELVAILWTLIDRNATIYAHEITLPMASHRAAIRVLREARAVLVKARGAAS